MRTLYRRFNLGEVSETEEWRPHSPRPGAFWILHVAADCVTCEMNVGQEVDKSVKASLNHIPQNMSTGTLSSA